MDCADPAVWNRTRTAEWFARHALSRADRALTPDDWAAMADLFAEDAVYFESHHGYRRGRAAIREFMRTSMTGFDDWRFPIQWVEVGERRVVVQFLNRTPGVRPDGSFYEFPGITVVEYGDDGLIRSQFDLFDTRKAIVTYCSWRLRRALARVGLVGRERAFNPPALKA